MVLVDSSAWIGAFRRDGEPLVKLAVEALLEAYEATLCAPVRLEVLGGARKQERQKMQNYFNILPYVPLTEVLWQRAVSNSWKLRDQGVTVPWNDLLIATVAAHHELRVYSLDKHFVQMQGLVGFALYQPGYMGRYQEDTEFPGL